MSRVQPAGELWCIPWELSLVANDRSAASILWMLTAHNSKLCPVALADYAGLRAAGADGGSRCVSLVALIAKPAFKDDN